MKIYFYFILIVGALLCSNCEDDALKAYQERYDVCYNSFTHPYHDVASDDFLRITIGKDSMRLVPGYGGAGIRNVLGASYRTEGPSLDLSDSTSYTSLGTFLSVSIGYHGYIRDTEPSVQVVIYGYENFGALIEALFIKYENNEKELPVKNSTKSLGFDINISYSCTDVKYSNGAGQGHSVNLNMLNNEVIGSEENQIKLEAIEFLNETEEEYVYRVSFKFRGVVTDDWKLGIIEDISGEFHTQLIVEK